MIGVFGRGGKETQASTLEKPGEDTGGHSYEVTDERPPKRPTLVSQNQCSKIKRILAAP